jgi:CheY-like chemotaxis protein
LEAELPFTQADPTQLEQVILNLCLNARDAMPCGGRISIETHSVQVSSDDAWRLHANAQPGSYVLLSVSDTGMGMNAATLERIFEPFFTTKTLGHGTGLGLASVHGIVQQHAGFVNVRSVLGEGSTFSVYLPIGTGAPETEENNPTEQEVPGGTETLLVAEDHDLLRQLTYETLSMQGYTVILASDGREAVRQFEENFAQIQLVILDFMMPGISGAEALARMRTVRPNLPAIFTTGYVVPTPAAGSEIAMKTPLLQKPYRPDVLARMIRDELDRKHT